MLLYACRHDLLLDCREATASQPEKAYRTGLMQYSDDMAAGGFQVLPVYISGGVPGKHFFYCILKKAEVPFWRYC